MYRIKNDSQSTAGDQKIHWVRGHMPILNEIEKQFDKEKPFKNQVVSICLHLEAKTGYMAEVFQRGGADVFISGSNPLSTDDEVCASLAQKGIHVYSWYGIDSQSHYENLVTLVEAEPCIIIDDGADLTSLLHSEKSDINSVKGACEETTTGITRVKALQKEGKLRFPVMAVNDAYCKHLFDNRYGTGQSALDGIMRTTNLVIAGKTVVVAGYGWVGKGVAFRARGLGAHVVVTEVDPVKALEAHMEGFHVMSMGEACSVGDIFVTCTGNIDVVREEHIRTMKNGAILCNAGHFDVEVDVRSLRKRAEPRKVRPNIEEYTINGRNLYLLGEGRLVNLACADGHPAEIMDLSFALQVLSARYLLEHELENKLLPVPEELDTQVAERALNTLGITIDVLNEKQMKYLNSWKYSYD